MSDASCSFFWWYIVPHFSTFFPSTFLQLFGWDGMRWAGEGREFERQLGDVEHCDRVIVHWSIMALYVVLGNHKVSDSFLSTFFCVRSTLWDRRFGFHLFQIGLFCIWDHFEQVKFSQTVSGDRYSTTSCTLFMINHRWLEVLMHVLYRYHPEFQDTVNLGGCVTSRVFLFVCVACACGARPTMVVGLGSRPRIASRKRRSGRR